MSYFVILLWDWFESLDVWQRNFVFISKWISLKTKGHTHVNLQWFWYPSSWLIGLMNHIIPCFCMEGLLQSVWLVVVCIITFVSLHILIYGYRSCHCMYLEYFYTFFVDPNISYNWQEVLVHKSGYLFSYRINLFIHLRQFAPRRVLFYVPWAVFVLIMLLKRNNGNIKVEEGSY